MPLNALFKAFNALSERSQVFVSLFKPFYKKNHFTVLEVETDAVYLKCSPNDLIIMLYFVDVSVLPTGMLPGKPNLSGNSPESEI